MQPAAISRAIAAVRSITSAHGMMIDDAVVLQNSNKLTLHLLPCDTLARIAPSGYQVARFEVELAIELAATGSPAVTLDPRIPPRVYERDGFAVTFWSYHAPLSPDVASAEYGDALRRLHIGMRKIDMRTPHFLDRVDQAALLMLNRQKTPELPDLDREFLIGMLKKLASSIVDRGAAEQLLHGEPHSGNVLSTQAGPLFIDLETCCRGPVEFDLAHVPDAVIKHYPDVDQKLLEECRALVLVMVAAWRWDADDQFPDGRRWAEHFNRILRKGAPWPSLNAVTRHLARSKFTDAKAPR